MKDIRGIEKLKLISTALTLSDFRLITRLVFEHEEHAATLYCQLTTDQFDPKVVIELKFYGVSNLRINELSNYESRVDGFDVRNVSSNGLEEISWEVIDFEGDIIHWYSSDAEVISITKL